uniref:Uncharacterized protein n=1 Tax=Romanomermis culicivorax TaxID=13658 RepID=A0A915KIT8_ROMCU
MTDSSSTQGPTINVPQGDRRLSTSSLTSSERGRLGSQSGPSGGRRMSRCTEIRPSVKPNRPLMEWLYANFDKATVGLAMNFLILIVLLMMLKNLYSFIPSFTGGGGGAANDATNDPDVQEAG